jgi:large subunit ribosomal protein L10
MATQKKIDTVGVLTEKVKKSSAVIFADYRGLKHKQLEELRKNLKKSNAEFAIVKNRLFLRAVTGQADRIKDVMQDTSAVVFSYADQVAPLKELLKFFKGAGIGKTKGGLLGDVVLTDSDVTKLSQLPSRDILIGQVVGRMKSPLYGLHYALSWNLNRLVWALDGVKNAKASAQK